MVGEALHPFQSSRQQGAASVTDILGQVLSEFDLKAILPVLVSDFKVPSWLHQTHNLQHDPSGFSKPGLPPFLPPERRHACWWWSPPPHSPAHPQKYSVLCTQDAYFLLSPEPGQSVKAWPFTAPLDKTGRDVSDLISSTLPLTQYPMVAIH